MAGRKQRTSEEASLPLFSNLNESAEKTAEDDLRKEDSNGTAAGKAFLIDANSLIHRAFHALPTSLRNSKGEVVNAVYGFASMLIKIMKDFKPDFIIAAFDSREPTFRHQIFTDYKANRPETADELIPQFSLAKKVLDAFDIPYAEIKGFEADDILATLARYLEERGFEVYILSGDRDMLQLVSEKVRVVTTTKGVSEVKIYDRRGVFERFGVYPEEIPDFLALKGETSDNIPGIPGIGEKTAAELVRKYGTLERIFEKIDELKNKRFYSSLLENRENAFRVRELVILRKDIPLQAEELLKKFSFSEEKVARTFMDLEFQSLLRRLSIAEKRAEVEIKLTEKGSEDSVEAVISEALSKGKCFVAAAGSRVFLGAGSKFARVLRPDELEKVLAGRVSIYTNDLKELVKLLPEKFEGFLEKKAEDGQVHDLSILLWLNNPDRKRYGLTDYFEGDSWVYHLHDLITWSESLHRRIAEEGMQDAYRNVEIKIPFVLAHMEESGIPVDVEKLQELKKNLEREIENVENSIYSLAGVRFNIDSPKQLGHLVYDVLKISPPPRFRKKRSTEQQVLLKLIDAHPLIERVLTYRELTKLLRTYVEPFIEKVDLAKKRIYGRFLQTGTATGRLSSEDPNLQNLPLKGSFAIVFREAISCDEGRVFIAADYANIELRVLAHLSGDEKLIEAFEKDVDIHTRTASEVLGIPQDMVDERFRRIAKAINFGIIYGVSPEGLSEQAGITQDDARKYIETYFREHPGVKAFIERIVNKAYEDGYVETLFKRKRYLPGLKSSSVSERNTAKRLAMNTPVQGSAADIIKVAMLKLYEELKKLSPKASLVLQIHDSLVVEADEEVLHEVSRILKETMENAVKLKVPLKVNVKHSRNLAGL